MDRIFDKVITGAKSCVEATCNFGQMPILLENPTQEIKYLVGAQLSDLMLPPKDAPEEDTNIINAQVALPTSTTKLLEEIPKAVLEENKEEEDRGDRGSSPPPDMDRQGSISLMPKLVNIEKIIPESDNSSNSEKSD